MSEAVQWLLKALPNYVLTFGRVFVRPKTEILEKCKGGESAVPGALGFFAVSQLVFFPLARGTTDLHSDFWLTVFRTVSMSVIGGFGTVAALALAWRMTGARIEFSKLLVAYCYISSVSFVLGSVLNLATLGVLKTLYPDTFTAFERAAPKAPIPLSPKYAEYIEEIQKTMPNFGGFQKALFWAMLISILLLVLWMFGAWGIFRRLAEVGRLRSATALAIFILLLLCCFGPLTMFMEWGSKSGGFFSGERSGLLTRTAATESVLLCAPTKSSARLSNLNVRC